MRLTDEQVNYDLYSKLGSRVLAQVRRSVPMEDYKAQSIILLRGLSFRDVSHRIYRLMCGCHNQTIKKTLQLPIIPMFPGRSSYQCLCIWMKPARMTMPSSCFDLSISLFVRLCDAKVAAIVNSSHLFSVLLFYEQARK